MKHCCPSFSLGAKASVFLSYLTLLSGCGSGDEGWIEKLDGGQTNNQYKQYSDQDALGEHRASKEVAQANDASISKAADEQKEDVIREISFSLEIVPSIKSDCRSCHFAGQDGIKLTGSIKDYTEIMRYVQPNDPEGMYGFLWWASGGEQHPVSWPQGNDKYNLFLEWVEQGAKNN